MRWKFKVKFENSFWGKPYPCNQWLKAFSHNGNSKNHLRNHSGKDTNPCNQCQKAFSQDGILKKFIQGRNATYAISVPKFFLDIWTSMKHVIINLWQRPFHCNQCPKAFSVIETQRTILEFIQGKTIPLTSMPKNFFTTW